MTTLSIADARRLATASVGLTPTGRASTGSATGALLNRLGLLQLDPLARVERAHRLTAFARLPIGARGEAVDTALWPATGAPTTFELLSGVACVHPIADWPLFEDVRARIRASPKAPPRDVLESILDIVRAHPEGVLIGTIEHEGQRTRGWEWSQRRYATEHLVRNGELAVSTRRGGQRVYAIAESVIPEAVRAVESSPEARAEALVVRAAGALGVGTAADLAKHYWLSPAIARAAILRAEANERLHRVAVEGWSGPGWVVPDSIAADGTIIRPELARGPRLIGPFDSLLRDRVRARNLFDFDYLFEAYKPVETRVFGHYVLGVFHGSRFLGRVDAQRTGGQLRLRGAWAEPDVRAATFATAALTATERLATQLGVEPEASVLRG